jgi:hypothetical protein
VHYLLVHVSQIRLLISLVMHADRFYIYPDRFALFLLNVGASQQLQTKKRDVGQYHVLMNDAGTKGGPAERERERER